MSEIYQKRFALCLNTFNHDRSISVFVSSFLMHGKEKLFIYFMTSY